MFITNLEHVFDIKKIKPQIGNMDLWFNFINYITLFNGDTNKENQCQWKDIRTILSWTSIVTGFEKTSNRT